MKILSFGHIPSWAGGRQESGLANVIFNLARNMAEVGKDSVYVRLAATDMTADSDKYAPLYLYGWTYTLLIRHILLHPVQALKMFFHLVECRKKYGRPVDVKRMFMKAVFLRHCIDDFKPDILHLHGANNIVYFPIIPENVKIIMTRHGKVGGDDNIKDSNLYALFERDCCKSPRISRLYFISSQLVEDYKTFYGEIQSEVEVILNAYDSDNFYYIQHKTSEKPVLITIASLSDLKGQERVLKAIADSKLQCKYICIGSDSHGLSEQLLHFAKENGIDYSYVGTKKPSEIRELLSLADFMIMPSSSEGFGLVYIESIACGVPVVLPKNLPIVKEKAIIRPEANAVLLEDCSVESISVFLDNISSYSFDHEGVAKTVSDYSWANIANQYINSIKEIT